MLVLAAQLGESHAAMAQALARACARRAKPKTPSCSTGSTAWGGRSELMHSEALPEVERVAGSGAARPVRPLVRPEFLEAPRDPAEVRAELGLLLDRKLIVVSGGA